MEANAVRVGPYVVIEGGGWVVRLLVGEGDAGLLSPCDFEVEATGLGRYVGVVATLEQLDELMAEWRLTGECLAGTYLWIKNLVVVERLEPALVADVVADLIRTGEIEGALQAVDEASDDKHGQWGGRPVG